MNREEIINKIREVTLLHNDTVLGSDVEKLADWHMAEVANIVNPIQRYKDFILKVMGTSSWDEKDGCLGAIDETLKRANGS
jgi:hypothetical protein